MKRWILVFPVVILLGFVGFFYFNKSALKPQTPSNVLSETDTLPSPSPSVWPQSTLINVDGASIRISWAIVNPEDVELHSNLEEKRLSEEIKVNNSCETLVNGGFYSKENTHLGFFVSNFKEVSNSVQNATLNGFIWINANNEAKISADPPNITPRWGLQTGPLLILDNKPLALAIKNDEPARRIVAGTTENNKLIFIVFYRDQSEMEGPMLEKLPEIINFFKKKTDIKVVDAINLDGGSASVFISNYDLLREFTPIGSYFCAK